MPSKWSRKLPADKTSEEQVWVNPLHNANSTNKTNIPSTTNMELPEKINPSISDNKDTTVRSPSTTDNKDNNDVVVNPGEEELPVISQDIVSI